MASRRQVLSAVGGLHTLVVYSVRVRRVNGVAPRLGASPRRPASAGRRSSGILSRLPSYYRDPDAPTPNRPRKVGVCFIVEIDRGVLIDMREDDGSLAFTGGTLEEDESVHEAVSRELFEETGLRVRGMTLLGVFSDPSRIVAYRDGAVHRVLSIAFIVTPKPGTPPRPSEESLELRIVSRAELRDLPFWPAHRPIRDAYLAFDGNVVVQ